MHLLHILLEKQWHTEDSVTREIRATAPIFRAVQKSNREKTSESTWAKIARVQENRY